ncbi:hypothetical protein A2318_02775 [Candidatus Uhrbacteria bacterium RIFOXYB2_FULL_45_11]|uniref:Uncharacterized protein n=1 Tax=Candidatus Uhrbacteria bacterium RIFOXYB2_FULL_45_11 TaxID=1802421 RepID=A0A1F7W3H2_9BACT|nr:MAG: hypothetical protein A2318_02775 [Candidatus Uhrbacteria bacterium RIFOXYB2_FULL_45_11]
MSRVEKTEEPQKTSPYIKDEVVETFGDQKKKTHRRFSCLGLALVCLVLFVGFCAWQVAATGLVNIPVFSSFAYSEAQPVRVIKPGVSVEQYSESFFTSTILKRLQAGGGVLTDRSIVLALPESSLTTSLQNGLKQSGETRVVANRAQIAVLEGQELELFLPIQFNKNTTALTVHFSLHADQGSFVLNLLDVKIGSFRAPSVLVASFVQPFVNRELATLNKSLSSYMHVDSLTTQKGVLSASGTFTVQIQK